MTSPIKYAAKYPTLCGCCRRRASWVGFTPSDRNPIMWLCEDPVCHLSAKKVYRMKSHDLDHFEGAAVLEGVDAAGSYAAEIGKCDIRDMTEIELSEFGRRFYVTICKSLQTSLAALNR